jgi:hypothetical protein
MTRSAIDMPQGGRIGGAGVTVLAGCTGSTATSVRPAPAASGPGLSRAALDRMHERMAGYVERGEIPGIVALVTGGRCPPRRRRHMHTGVRYIRARQARPSTHDRLRRRITWNRVEDGMKIAVLVADDASLPGTPISRPASRTNEHR